MLRKVISGGQTGIDQLAWELAKQAGLETGGTMPKGFLTEAGKRPGFAATYGAIEHPTSAKYPDRTRANVFEADATLILTRDPGSAGTLVAIHEARRLRKPWVVCSPLSDHEDPITQAREDAPRLAIPDVLNVGGTRGSMMVEWFDHYASDYLMALFDFLRPGRPMRAWPKRKT